MPLLTLENLDTSNYSFYGDYQAFLRGRAYYSEKRVTILEFDGESATCQVNAEQGIYKVLAQAISKKQVQMACDCPQAAKARICKHMVATAMTLRDYLQHEAQNRWQYRLDLALQNTPKQKTIRGPWVKYAIVFGLQVDKTGSAPSFRLLPHRIKSQDWGGMQALEKLSDPQAQAELMDKDRSWSRAAEVIAHSLDYRSVVNLPMEGTEMYNMMLTQGGGSYYYYGVQSFTSYLPLMAKLQVPLFQVGGRGSFKERLQVLTQPETLLAALAREGQSYTLQAGLNVNGKLFTTAKESLLVISKDPAWVMAGQYILPIENPESLNLLGFFPLVIPKDDEQEFRDHYFHSIAERIPIQGDIVSWEDVRADPTPRLYLRDDEGKLRASLKYGYADEEVDANPRSEDVTMRDIPDSWGMLRIYRQLEKEAEYYQLLTDARYGLKRAGSEFNPGTFELRARTHPFDFLLHSVPALTQAGFEIYGEKDLHLGKINRATPSISLNITSGLDWFDIDAVVKYGDQEVALHDVRRALRRGDRYVKLADGSVGQIPENWLERYKHLFELAEETENGLRISDLQIPLVDQLLEDSNEAEIVPEFQQRRERLQNFEQIQPQQLPQGFTGELRPYQKAGLDWLHFLHEYNFGGCLADDMGLGKTIQVLAFLQSLKEKGLASAATLLVVPKSLLANWQREAEKFTPGLRFLEFMGQTRKKETEAFGEYDVVMTTYGTMLRDVEFLRSYRFHYAILDESQAIKNPMAQSSKAARLINAEHRLVMTGTPVENNTFELWSQFAYLTPGLLGTVDYFKKEFATPIENRDEASQPVANLLRKLVYPFILRRTKEQVAPELPPRTERLIFIDLEPAQRKLYNHTRDYYRGMLMGMIDSQGIDDVRMKILEGLLRLRQICIHPALVEPTFKGESAKFEILFETLETLQAEHHKALIFSQFVQTLSLLRTHLDGHKIPYTYLDGQTKDRQGQVDTFQNDPAIPFFLISLKAGGVGLNLTAADYVIHIDPWWNPAVEMQAADRAHRIGQDKPVFIYKFIARDSVEEKILKLQERKRELVEQLISAEGSFFKSMTQDDVKVLFS